MVELETRNGKMVKTLDTLYDEYIEQYLEGNFTEGFCNWGDDALMSPMTFGKRFAEYCERLGYDATESVSYTHLRAHETVLDLVCRLLLEK